MEKNNKKSNEEDSIQVIFRKKNPVHVPSSSSGNKVVFILKRVIIWAFWILVAYIIFGGIVVPTMTWCNINAPFGAAWNC